ncbi:CoA-binding protein [Paracoccus sp. (in: a-proteobacteria)]|uniref:CoA-binding protein n=1 Tax=Paracoccus sp. TaxID=267 RepID=UPI00289AEF5E|nr:CoA-binding protein [Paracoccus sp. (in: a-proteobacteria)]
MSDEDIARVLKQARTIAIVGMSPKEDRPSWGVARFLKSQGYRVIPVNPGHAGSTFLDETVYADLKSIPAEVKVDMVDIFRRPEAVAGIVDEALQYLPDLKSIWMQLGVRHAEASAKARKAGIAVIEDRCPKIELPRLGAALYSV